LKDSIADSIRRYGFKRLLLAVSGGLDSICLAHYFICNKEALDIEWLGIAHVHHGLREGTADRDAAFVETFAKAHDVPFFLKKLDGKALKNADGSLEENAREARYKALQESAENCDAIVTAHHAGDQAETMYMRLRRGTTLAGLRGIQDVRDNIYRPFLNVTREELLAYARENNLNWCEDESNSDVKFARNKVRHVYLPQLAREYCDAATQLCRIASFADKAYAKVIDKCNELFNPIVSLEKEMSAVIPALCQDGQDISSIKLNKKALRKVLLAHVNTDLSEMFRLWLSELGFRFPIGFFYDQKEPAHVKIPVRSAYRKRSIVKNGSTVLICEFEDVQSASKFVSCKMKD
jgi:tRNA(Ile)-lysidine synthase